MGGSKRISDTVWISFLLKAARCFLKNHLSKWARIQLITKEFGFNFVFQDVHQTKPKWLWNLSRGLKGPQTHYFLGWITGSIQTTQTDSGMAHRGPCSSHNFSKFFFPGGSQHYLQKDFSQIHSKSFKCVLTGKISLSHLGSLGLTLMMKGLNTDHYWLSPFWWCCFVFSAYGQNGYSKPYSFYSAVPSGHLVPPPPHSPMINTSRFVSVVIDPNNPLPLCKLVSCVDVFEANYHTYRTARMPLGVGNKSQVHPFKCR